MTTKLIAFAYLWFAVSVAAFVSIRIFRAERPLIFKVYITYTFVTLVGLLAPHPGLFVIGVAAFLLSFSPKDLSGRLFFYFAMLPALPAWVEWSIPFPGLDRLFDLRYPTLLTICVLAPMVGRAASLKAHSFRPNAASKVICLGLLYFVLKAALDLRGTTLTNGLRGALELALSFGIILYVVARSSKLKGVTEKVLQGLLIGGIFLAFIGIIQYSINWFLYDQMAPVLRRTPLLYQYAFGARGGALRMPGTMTPIPFGLYLAICFSIAIYFCYRDRSARLLQAVAVMFLACVILSDSRGAMLGLLISVIMIVYYSRSLRRARSALAFAAITVAILGVFGLDALDRIVGSDEHGTFQYRIDLVHNSMHSISNHLIFGTPYFMEDPVLQQSRQGQGIIDIVNSYLYVALRYGLFGLVLFVWPLLVAFRSLAKGRKELERQGDDDRELMARCLLAALAGFAVAILTVSMVDRLDFYYWILIAIAAGMEARSVSHGKNAVSKSSIRKTGFPQYRGHHRASF